MAAGLALLCLGQAAAPGRTIEWGNAAGDTLSTSSGTPLDDTFIFELGTFGSFVPTAANMSLWAANWKVFDRAVAPDTGGWNSLLGFFNSTANLLSDGTSSASPPLPPYTFLQNEQAYIWVYNGLTIDALTEWALITNNALDGNSADDWLMPDAGDQTTLPLEWRLSNASAVLYGGLNNVEGAGGFSVIPPDFALQTHTVPEPSTMLLTLLAGMGALLRRTKT